MKKLVIATLLAAATGLALAQNVTVYGVIDTGIQSYDNGTNSRYTRMQGNIYRPSHFGVKGVEDLGSGLKATVQLEGLITPGSGTFGSTTETNRAFNREASVALSGNFGEIRAGVTDVSMASELDSFTSKAVNLGLSVIPGTAVEMGADQSNVIRYSTPTISGFQFMIGTTTNASASATDAGTEQTGTSLTYKSGALALGAGYHKVAGTGVAKKDSKVVAAGYDFGAFFVGANYVEADNSTTADVNSKATMLRVSVPVNSTLTAHAMYAIGEDGSQSTNNKGTGYTLALVKDLSKRTSLYAAYNAVNNQANSSMYHNYIGTALASAGRDTKSLAVGVTHSF